MQLEVEEKEVKYPKGRKSLAVDFDTYNLLQDICRIERRSKIDQLRVLIENKHNSLTDIQNTALGWYVFKKRNQETKSCFLWDYSP